MDATFHAISMCANYKELQAPTSIPQARQLCWRPPKKEWWKINEDGVIFLELWHELGV